MLYSFAITPDVFEPWAVNDTNREGVILVELLRGMVENGLLANLHGGQWITHVRRCQDADKKAPELRAKINTCLNLLSDRKRLVNHPKGSARDEADECRWLFWALERHRTEADNRFQGIFSTAENIDLSELVDDTLIPLLRALDCPGWQGRRQSIRFPKTQVELRRHLAPLVRYASMATLIDPYLVSHKAKFFDTVQHCASLLGKRDGTQKAGRIRIHAGDPRYDTPEELQESPADRLDRWAEALRPVAAQYGHKFRVSLWANRPGGKRFHDRYLLTDQCGVRAPGGLDFVEDPTQANLSGWSLLDHAELTDIIQNEFHPSKSPYCHLGSRDVQA